MDGGSENAFSSVYYLHVPEGLTSSCENGKSSSNMSMELEEEYVLSPNTLEHVPTAGFSSSSANLLKTILGAGILAMPSAFASIGYIPGILFIILAASCAAFGLHLFVVCSGYVGRGATVSRLSAITYPRLSILFDIAIALKCFGVAVSFLIVIGDLMPSLAKGIGLENAIFFDRKFWLVIYMTFMTPLAFLKRISSLKYTSFAGILAVCYLIFIAIWNFSKFDAHRPPPNAGVEPFADMSFAVFKSFSVFVFSFTCHQNIFPIQRESIDNSPKFMNRIILFCIISATALYLLFSIISYANFGQIVQGNIFRNYPSHNVLIIIARLLFSLLSAFSYPLQTLPCRLSLEHLLPISKATHSKYKNLIHNSLTSVIVLGSFACALVLDNLFLVSGIIGTIASIPICYILPFVFYFKLSNMEGWTIKRILSAGLALFGVIAMVVSGISIVLDILYPFL